MAKVVQVQEEDVTCEWCDRGDRPFIAANRRPAHRGPLGVLHWCTSGKASTEKDDATKYRVTLVCACNADMAYGYGASVAEAEQTARREFRRQHGRAAKVGERIVEHAVESASGASHYEELR